MAIAAMATLTRMPKPFNRALLNSVFGSAIDFQGTCIRSGGNIGCRAG
jgi:hypothetical protein